MGGRYYGGGRLPDPYVPEVGVPDFGRLEGQALANAFRVGQVDEMGQEIRGRNALNEALRGGYSRIDALSKLSSEGHGDYAGRHLAAALRDKSSEFDLKTKGLEYTTKMLNTVQTPAGARAFFDEMRRLGYPPSAEWEALADDIPELKKRASELIIRVTNPLGAALLPGQLAQQKATLAHTQGAEQREAELQDGRVQGQALGNQGQTLTNQGRQADLEAVEEGYALPGNRFISTRDALRAYHETKAGNPDPDFTFEKYIAGLRPATKHRKSGVITVDEQQAQPPNAPQTAPQGQGANAAILQEAKDAVKRGANKAAVWKELKEKHGVTDQEIWSSGL